MTNFTADVSQIIVFIGVMAFIVSVITEALKKWTWFDKKRMRATSGRRWSSLRRWRRKTPTSSHR